MGQLPAATYICGAILCAAASITLPIATNITMKRVMNSGQPSKAVKYNGRKLAGRKMPLVLAGLVVVVHSGCYDGEVLVTQARSAALNTRLAEIDLGSFHTSLPRDPKSGLITELGLHIFGNVPHYRVSSINRQMTIEEYRLRHEIIAAVRATSNEELAEPSLKSLRARIEHIVNGILEEAPVEAIGFYKVAIRQM
jgi:hypothetical protein